MPPWLQQLLQNGKFWVFGIAIGISVIGKVLKALEKQGKERQAKQDQQKRELEALRTGRPQEVGAPTQIAATQKQPFVPWTAAAQPGVGRPGQNTPGPSQASAREQLEALAAKRRAAIDELQRRRGGQTSPSPSARSPEPKPTPEQMLATMLGIPLPTQDTRAPGKPQVPVRTNRPANRPKPAAPMARSATGPRGSTTPPSDRGQSAGSTYAAPERATSKQTPLSPPHAVQPQRAAEVGAVTPTPAASLPDAVPVGGATRADPLGLRSLTRGDLRRALVLREIMDPPVTMRG